jgi:hypothetical protein
MGYRSDVVLMAVFANAEQHDEVMAVYRMDANVQKHDLEKAWRRVNLKNGEVVRIYEGNAVKWYEGYEDVQGLEYLSRLLADFHEERKFNYAWRKFNYAWGNARIGENETDIDYDTFSPDSNDLIEIVYDGLSISRAIQLGF